MTRSASFSRNHLKPASGLLLLSLTMFVASCGSVPVPGPEVIKTKREPLPLQWSNPTPVPACLDQLNTNGDLLKCAAQLESAANSCNRDKADLVKWAVTLPPIADQVKAPPADPPKRKWFWQ